MITVKELQRALDPRARWLVMNSYGSVLWFTKRPMTCARTWVVPTSSGECINGMLGKIDIKEFQGEDWTDCIIELEPDSTKLIGCLCWFWDAYVEDKILDVLVAVNDHDYCRFKTKYDGKWYANCEHVYRDDITFWEDKV